MEFDGNGQEEEKIREEIDKKRFFLN